MKKLFFLFTIIFISTVAFSQKRIATGIVFDNVNKKPVDSAMVKIRNTKQFVNTDEEGRFSIFVPGGRNYLQITHPDFQANGVNLKTIFWKHPIDVGLLPIESAKQYDSVWLKNKNGLSWLPFELITGSVGLQYERVLAYKQSVGVHASFYLFGWGIDDILGVSNRFNGFKLAPFYRYYLTDNKPIRYFVEGQVISGYFHFWQIDYYHDRGYYSIDHIYNFWSFGGGIAFGLSLRPFKAYHSFMNFSIGGQYFPTKVPEKLQTEHYTYSTSNTWWYVYGPGAVVQFKLAFGGFF